VSESDSAWLDTLRRDRNRGNRSLVVALILSVLLGWLGADRLYLGYPWLALLKALTVGGLMFWWALDILLIATGNMCDADGDRLG